MKASVHDTHRTEIYTGRPMRRWLAGWRWDVTALKCIIALPKTKMKPKHEDVEDEFHSQKEGFRGSMLVFQGCYILGCSPHLVIKSDHQDGMTFFFVAGIPIGASPSLSTLTWRGSIPTNIKCVTTSHITIPYNACMGYLPSEHEIYLLYSII